MTAMATPDIENLLARAQSEGVSLWPDGTSLHYRAPDRLAPDLRDLVVANKPALLARLAAWDAAEASRLEFATDGAVADSGVSGRDAEIAALAGECVAAHHVCDMPGVRRACALIAARVRQLSAKRTAEAA